MRLLIALFFVMCFTLSAKADMGVSFSDTYVTCIDQAMTDSEMVTCIGEEYLRTDVEFNKVYKNLMKLLTPEAKAALVVSERAWLAFMEKDCEFIYSMNEGGTVADLNRADCRLTMISARNAELKEYLHSLN